MMSTPSTAALCIGQAEAFLAAGNPLPAYDVTRAALERWPQDVRLRQLYALALLRSGSPESARPTLEGLVAEGAQDEETLGLLARVYKDAALRSAADERAALLTRAADLYRRAWELHRSTWTGVNAATCLLLMGRRPDAVALARDVRRRANDILDDPRHDRYWTEATLGELSVIAGNVDEARGHYARAAAVAMPARRYGDLASTRRNAALLLQATVPGVALDALVPAQRVAVFSGHQPDAAGRTSPRFPRALEAPVAERIRAAIETSRAVIGYSSAAAGGDLLFIEALLACGREAHVLLPFREEEFIEASIRPSGAAWVERWYAVRERVASVGLATEDPLARPDLSYEYTNRLLHGMARLRARALGSDTIGLAVWDPSDPLTIGGTTAAVHDWIVQGLPYEVIDVAAMRRADPARRHRAPAMAEPAADSLSGVLAAFVFCDAVGFSRLTDAQMPSFVNGFLQAVGTLIDEAGTAPLLRNTWGDGMFFVFGSVADAARFALNLVDTIASVNRAQLGLPDSLTLRVGIHAGPVYRCLDPITKAPNYFGAHVSRAARIEPVTPPGQVFGSEPCAALLAASHADDVECEYAGSIPLAKTYGSFPMYHVRRAAALTCASVQPRALNPRIPVSPSDLLSF